jgi:hypothetical protein
MALPTPSRQESRTLFFAIGVVVGVVIGVVLGIVLQPPSSGGGSGPSGSTKTPTVHSHTWAISAGGGRGGTPGPVSVYSHTWAVSSTSPTTTPGVNVEAGSAVFLFVGYSNGAIGGGSVVSVTDSSGDNYRLVTSTGFAQNHTEDLYESAPVPTNTSGFTASVSFAGGATAMGGSVALIDVAGTGTPFVDAVSTQSGPSGTNASVDVAANYTADLFLLGVSGQAKDAPFVGGLGETLLDTGSGTSGPFENGEGLGTFSDLPPATNVVLSATLSNSAVWNAIGVAIFGSTGGSPADTTTTPTVNVLGGSVVFLFVGYVNPLIGGGEIVSITDTAHDSYSFRASTELATNHTEALYTSGPIVATTTLNVTVTMGGGATPMGSSVALIDVNGSSAPQPDGIATQSGVGVGASVSLFTNHTGDLILLGVSGQEKDSPFSAGAGETLLDTAGNTTGPFEDGMGLGTFTATATAKGTSLSATLANAAVWNAIAVGIDPPSSPMGVSPGSAAPPSGSLGLVPTLAITARVQ